MPTVELKECLVCRLGLIPFPEAMEYEHRLLQMRFEEKIGDVLLLLEHPPTITLGRFGEMKNVLLPPEALEKQGIAFYHADRGGDATFNCPGQPVIHPIMDLHYHGARNYISNMEELGLRVLAGYGITGERTPAHRGIWVKGQQIGAIGMRMRHGITMHGMSLNACPDLAAFEVINLCGLPGVHATSIERETGSSVSSEEVTQRIIEAFPAVFGVELRPLSREELHKVCFEGPPCETVLE